MPMFDVSGTIAPAATKTPVIYTGSATLRAALREFMAATIGVPSSEASFQIDVRPSTAAGTSTAVTPRPRNGVSVAGGTAGSNCSAEPTYTAGQPLLRRQGNPRNSLQWNALQGDAEINSIASANNGFGAQIIIPGGALTSVDVDIGVYE